MTLTGSTFSFRSGQIESQPQELARARGYVVFTDGVSPRDDIAPSTGSRAAAALAEQAFHDFFESETSETITKESLEEAFRYVNRRVLELFGSDDDEVAVSALIVVEGETLLIAGLGDITLYGVRPGQAELLFSDPQTPQVDGIMSAEERHLSLHNAIGTGEELAVHTMRHTPNTFERYVAASYGMSREGGVEAIRQLGSVPEEAVSEVLDTLSFSANGPHEVSMALTSQQSSSEDLTSNEPTSLLDVADNSRKAREKKLALALTGATCALVLFVLFQVMPDNQPAQVAESNMVHAEENSQDVDLQNASWVAALKEQVRQRDELIRELREELDLAEMGSAPSGDSPGVEDLMQQLSERNTELRQLRLRSDQLSKQLDKREGSISDLELTVQALEERLSKPRGKGKVSGRDLAKSRKLEREVNKLKAQLGEKDEMLKATKETNRDYADRYRKLEGQLTAKLDELSNSYEREQGKQNEMRHDLAERVRELTSQLNSQVSRNRSLVADLKQMEEAVSVAPKSRGRSTANSNAEVAQLRSSLKQEEKKNSILKEELASALERGQTMGSEEVMAQLLREQEMTTSLKGQLEDTLAQLENLKSGLSTRNDSSKVIEQRFQVRLDELSTAYQKEKEQSKLLQSELNRVIAETSEQSTTFETKVQEVALTEQKLEKVTEERNALLDDKASLMDQVVAMEQFQELYNNEKAKREQGEREFQAFAKQLEEQKSAMSNMETTRSAMSSELAKLRREYDRLLRERRGRGQAVARAATNRRVAAQPVRNEVVATPVATETPTPKVEEAVAAARVHIVARGETLSGIAMRYYGAPKYWTDIYNANQEQIANTKSVRVGTPLVIPNIETNRG